MSDWFETFFDALANDVWRALVPDEVSDAEADFLERRLGLERARPARVLDLACGEGRLALRLGARGHAVTGVDLSSDAVGRLRRAAAEARVPVDVVLSDLRDLSQGLAGGEPFDGAYCMGNSFGYLDPAGTRTVLAHVAALLRPGARLVVDHATAAECVLPGYEKSDLPDRYEADGVLLEVAQTYDLATSTLVASMTLDCDGDHDVREARHRVATIRETVDHLDACGFDVVALEAGTDGTPFSVGAAGLIVTAELR